MFNLQSILIKFTEAVNELTGVDVLGLVVMWMLVYDVVVVVVGRSPPGLRLQSVVFLSLLCRSQPLQASCIHHALFRASEMRCDVVTDRHPHKPQALPLNNR